MWSDPLLIVNSLVSTAAGDDNAYALALPTLLAHGADDIAGQLRGDLHKLNRASR